jgi:hypothetical protein
VLKGVTARLPVYADSTYFILFNRALQGMLERSARVEDAASGAGSRNDRYRGGGTGEAVVTGEPVLTMIPEHGTWFGFNLREDQLRDLAIRAAVPVRSSGSVEAVDAKLVELRNLGEFAVWRAARATGDHDRNTFFLRLDPVAAATDMMPGQTVWLAR